MRFHLYEDDIKLYQINDLIYLDNNSVTLNK